LDSLLLEGDRIQVGKIAIVTGSTSSIGLGFATAMLPIDGGWTAH
jgi:NAD(P)-dependent dehydrogenase (short-subunit alcohol dehydrogenase family)